MKLHTVPKCISKSVILTLKTNTEIQRDRVEVQEGLVLVKLSKSRWCY